MQCPHCTIHFHDNWQHHTIPRHDPRIGQYSTEWSYKCAQCPECNRFTIELKHNDEEIWRRAFPLGAARIPIPSEVPQNLAADYSEACAVLPLSPKASAALARRCLQVMLNAHGYTAKDLARQIDAILKETDATKAIPFALRDTIDGIRNFGNFSAHPITDQTTLQIIDVEPHEAEWCLDTVEEMFQHFYVQPAQAKARKAALDAKLKAAGKPPSK